jgi:2-polyprenyl-6-methoxyphenol hydroxylase-like FAD-dependent oxidoreductase
VIALIFLGLARAIYIFAAPHSGPKAMTTYVVGAGIGGLSFAISFVQSRGAAAAKDIVVLERNGDESFHKAGSFVSSLSLRDWGDDVGGLPALRDLGVLEAARRAHTAATKDFVARSSPAGLSKIYSAGWWSRGGAEKRTAPAEALLSGADQEASKPYSTRESVRISRGDLWRVLYDKALELGVEIRFGCNTRKIDGPGHRILFGDGRQDVTDAAMIVLASGAWTDLCETSPLVPLNYCMMGGMATVGPVWPEGIEGGHGLIFTDSGECLLFVSHEDGRNISIGLAFEVSGHVDRTDPEALAARHAQAIALARAHLPPSLSALLVDQVLAQPSGAPLLVNCRHREEILPFDETEGILRLGDSWHAISPYAGAGANMAMVDGLRLGRAVLTPECKLVAHELASLWKGMFKREMSVINFAHGRGLGTRICRHVLLRGLPWLLQPAKLACVVVSAAGVCAALCAQLSVRRLA